MEYKGREDWRLVLSSHNRNGGNYRRMNGFGKVKSCRGEVGSIFLHLFADKKSEDTFGARDN